MRLWCCGSLEALARLKVNQEEATAWLRERGARWFYVLAPSPDQNEHGTKRFRARMQFNGGEDPATGSAAGCAIAYLVARGAVPSATRVHVRQGVEMGRPSDLFLSAQKEICEGEGCARGGQHSSCCKRAAFPAVMHMLSTDIHLRK